MKEWTAPDSRNTPSTTNLEEEETVDAPGNDGNAAMPEQVKRPNPWRKMMMMMIIDVTFSAFLRPDEHLQVFECPVAVRTVISNIIMALRYF